MLINQKANKITMESIGDCSMVINLKEHGVDIKIDGDNLSITIMKKADICTLENKITSCISGSELARATIDTLKAHADYMGV